MSNLDIDTLDIKNAIDSRLGDLTVDEQMKNRLLYQIYSDAHGIAVVPSRRKSHRGRRIVLGLVAACLCLIITIPLFGSNPGYNRIIHVISPDLAEILMPPVPTAPDDDEPVAIHDPILIQNLQATCDTVNTYVSFTLVDTELDRLGTERFSYGIEFGNIIETDYLCQEYYSAQKKELRVKLYYPHLTFDRHDVPVSMSEISIHGSDETLYIKNDVTVGITIYNRSANIREFWSEYRYYDSIALTQYLIEFTTDIPAWNMCDYEFIISYANGIIVRCGATLLDDTSFDLWQTVSVRSPDPDADEEYVDLEEHPDISNPFFFTNAIRMNQMVTVQLFFFETQDIHAMESVQLVFMTDDPVIIY